VAFLRMPAYYRYFFLAQIWALVFLLPNIDSILRNFAYKKIVLRLVFVMIFLVHIYSLFFRSWVADSYDSTRTKTLRTYFATEQASKNIFFVYQAPEIVTFFKDNNYYQFLNLAPNLPVGLESLNIINTDKIDRVITNYGQLDNPIFKNYTLETAIDRYVILKRK
jgi:hypothetical protein